MEAIQNFPSQAGFGKESYQLILKNGAKLRVSLSGYRLLRQRPGIYPPQIP